jgi:hypothetical protein
VPWSDIDELVVASYRLQAPKRLRLALDDLLEAAGEEPREGDEEPVDLDVPALAVDRRVVQIVEVATGDFEAVRAAEAAWRSATEGRRAKSRLLAGHGGEMVVLVVEYASAADAELDGELPETKAFFDALARVADAAPVVRRVEIDAVDVR